MMGRASNPWQSPFEPPSDAAKTVPPPAAPLAPASRPDEAEPAETAPNEVGAPAVSIAPTLGAQAPAFTAPYAAPVAPQFGTAVDAPLRSRSAGLGTVALVLGLLAAVVLPAVAGFLTWPVGVAFGRTALAAMAAADPADALGDLSWATPVADQVLWAELSLYAATGLGVVALVLGIMAIAQRRGRGAGIAAVVVAALGPVVFGLVVAIVFTTASGSAFA